MGCFGCLILLLLSFDLGSVTGEENEGHYFIYNDHFKPAKLDSLVRAYDHFLNHIVDSLKSPGAAVALVYNGEIMLLKGYGVTKAGEHDTIDIHTVFRLGSVSKGFASVLTGILVQEGSLQWNDRICCYVRDFKLADTASSSKITIRNILNQTTGLPEHTYTDMLDNGFDYEQIKGSLVNIKPIAKPGELYTYQNVAYSLIGDVLYQASGKHYNLLLAEKIFDPLHMDDASADFQTFYTNSNSAMPHLRAGSSWKVRPKNSRYYSASPASGINASASDMAKWLLALTGYAPDIVPFQTLTEISHPNIETPKKAQYRRYWKNLDHTYYGLGWRVFNVSGHSIVYHGGYVEGFRAEVAFDPGSKLGIAVLFNANTPVASQCIPLFINSFVENCMPDEDLSPLAADNL